MVEEHRLFDYRSLINELIPFLIVQNLSCSSEPIRNSELEKTIERWVHHICGQTAIDTNVEFKSYELRPFTFYEALASLQGIKNGKKLGNADPILRKSEKPAGYLLEDGGKLPQKQLLAEIELLDNLCKAIVEAIEKMRSKPIFKDQASD